LYEMLTGKKAFDADTEVGIIEKIKNAKINLEEAPAELRDILAKALQPDPALRYESAEAMQMDLAQALAKIQPGFLPKDLAEFMKAYPPEAKPIEQTQSQRAAPLPSSVSQSANTSISYIPGYNAPAVAPKKGRSVWIWLVPFLLLFFGSIAVAGYLAWTEVIQPRLAAKIPASPPVPVAPPPVAPSAPIPPAQPLPPPRPPVALSPPATAPAESQAANVVTPPPESAPLSQPAASQPAAVIPEKVELGQAQVVSFPEGASIIVNEQPTGLVTPATVGNLTLNQPHRIRLVKMGFFPLEAVYMPTTSALQRLDLPLRPAPVAEMPPRRRPFYPSEGGSRPLHQTPPSQGPNDSGIILYRR